MHKYATAAATEAVPRIAKDLLGLRDLSAAQVQGLLDLADTARTQAKYGATALDGKNVVLLFEKPSLRTRVSFEVAIRQLGGHPIVLGPAESRLGERESIEDTARNLSLWVDAVVARVFRQSDLERFADYSSVPVINALSDTEHPCQALADILTLSCVWPSFRGKNLTYVGDWNNVSRSLARVCAVVGLSFRAVGPEGFGPDPSENVDWTSDPAGVCGADALYTDVWASMGEEQELSSRLEAFLPYQVNESLMSRTRRRPLFMHCLPAHRGLEVTEGVIESRDSLVFEQAANRLPVAKAVLISLMESRS